jgi:hypothetical protein
MLSINPVVDLKHYFETFAEIPAATILIKSGCQSTLFGMRVVARRRKKQEDSVAFLLLQLLFHAPGTAPDVWGRTKYFDYSGWGIGLSTLNDAPSTGAASGSAAASG